jgi:hypothetical protein
MASVEQLVDMPHGVQRAAVCPIGVLFRLQVGLEDRFEHQNCRTLRHPVTDSGDGQRELHLSTVSIWGGRRSVTRIIRCAVNVSPY